MYQKGEQVKIKDTPVTFFGHTYNQQNDSALQHQLRFSLSTIKGFTIAHVEKWLENSRNFRFAPEHHNALSCLMDNEGLSIDCAIDEILGLCATQANVLSKLYQIGLRGKDLRSWEGTSQEALFTSNHGAALIYLMERKDLSARDALQEIYRLSDFQAALLRHYYQCNLRGEHLRSWQPFPGEGVFHCNHRSAVVALIDKANCEPEQAIKEIHCLPELQIEALQLGCEHGLRRQHLDNWQLSNSLIKFSITHSLSLITLLADHHLEPAEAIQMINGDGQQVEEAMDKQRMTKTMS